MGRLGFLSDKLSCGSGILHLISGSCCIHKKEQRTVKVPSWNPPGDGWLKCNFDGACYPDGKGATGAVIRDHNDTFHGGSAKWYGHCMDALTMEALAFRDAVIFAKQRGATRVVVFETDCHSLIHLWSMEDEQIATRGCLPRSLGRFMI